MALKDWAKHPNGDIQLLPVTGWELTTMPLNAIVRVEYAGSTQDIDARRPSAIQLVMSATQARALAQDLLRTAEAVDRQAPGTKQ